MSAQHIKIIGQRQPIMNLSPESLHAIKVVLMEQHKGHKSALPEKAFHCLYKHSILLKYHSEKALMHLGFCAKILQQNGIDLTQLIQKDRLLRLIQTSIDVLPDLASAFKKLSKLSVLNDTHCDMLMEFSKAELECFNACLPTSRNEAFDEESCSVLIKNIQHFKGAPHDLKGCITLMCNNKIEMTDLLGKGKLARLMALPPEELAAVKKIMDEWNKCYPLSDGIINKIIKNASKLPGKEQRICTYIQGMKRDELIVNLDIFFNPNKQKALRQALDCVRNSQTDQIDSSNVDPIDRTP